MSTKYLAATAIAALFASTAIAQEATPDTWINIKSTKSRAEVKEVAEVARLNGDLEHIRGYDVVPHSYVATLTRAEVLADLQIYRQSGLAELERVGEGSADVFTPEHRRAQGRYAALRASPEFAALVQSIAQRRGESVTVSGSATGTPLMR